MELDSELQVLPPLPLTTETLAMLVESELDSLEDPHLSPQQEAVFLLLTLQQVELEEVMFPHHYQVFQVSLED